MSGPDPSTMVDADDDLVGDLLAATIELVLEADGSIDPRARLVARDGQLSITGADGPLLRVPRAAMVRVDRVTWGADPDRVEILDTPDDIGDVELQLLYVQAALHNQCGRLPWLARTHPAVADLPAPLVAAVRRVVPSFRAPMITPLDLLWANRCFRIPLDDGPAERVLVPLVDLLNHHADGAAGSWDGVAFSVDARRPFGGDECALDYGMDRDAMELAVVYGFADASAHVAHTAPMTVDVPGVGEVSLDRMTFDVTDPGLPLRQVEAASGWDREDCAAVVQAVAESSLGDLQAIEVESAAAPGSGAARTLADAARHQAAVIQAAVIDTGQR